MRRIVFDTETTGLRADVDDRMIEIGCVELDGRSVGNRTLHLYFNPERTVPEEVVRVHGMTGEMLADKPKFAEVADEVVDFLRGAELIAHNASFDIGFLDMELRRAGKPTHEALGCRVVDTLRIAAERLPGKAKSLDSLCRYFGVDLSKRALHGALLDAQLLAEVYLALTRGQGTLKVDVASTDEGDLPALGDVSGLKVIRASAEERAAHIATLDAIVRENRKKGVADIWRQVEPPQEADGQLPEQGNPV